MCAAASAGFQCAVAAAAAPTAVTWALEIEEEEITNMRNEVLFLLFIMSVYEKCVIDGNA